MKCSPRYFYLLIIITACNCNSSSNNTIALQNELHAIYQADQQYREALSTLPPTSGQATKLWEKQNELDSLNAIRVSRILDSMGFPGKPLFDDSAGVATFMVIQHASLQLEEKYLPLFQKAAAQNNLKPAIVALMVDRVLVDKGEKQVYGTQAIAIKDPKTGYITDKYELAPIEDEMHVNERRAAVGLPDIQEGAKELGVDYTPPANSAK